MTIFDNIAKPKILCEKQSDKNGLITVTQDGNVRKIMVDNISQSMSANSTTCGRLYWGKIIEVLKQERADIENILILGLGGGTLSHLVSKSYPHANITTIEYDPVMVEVAQEYFDIDSIPNHKVIVEDALRVVVDPMAYDIEPQEIDVVIVDIFNGSSYPDLGKSGNFVGAVCDLLKTGGLVIFNRIYTLEHQEDVNAFIKFLEGFLEDVDTYTVAGYTNSDNIIIYGKV